MSDVAHRSIRSFVLRQGRTTAAQARAHRELLPRYGIPFAPVPLDLERALGRSAPRVLEIGFGMGETIQDRASMLHVLAAMNPHPESVPINALVPVEGTPLADRPRIDPLELVRMVATARLVMPTSTVRLYEQSGTLGEDAGGQFGTGRKTRGR